MKLLSMSASLVSLAVAGCATYGGATMLSMPIEVSPSRSATVRTPDAIQTATGTRFHGAVCRNIRWNSPATIRVERIGVDGAVISAVSRALSRLGGRGQRCAFYDVPTEWTLTPGERVRVCATRADAPCASKAPGTS